MLEHLNTTYKVLGSIPSTEHRQQEDAQETLGRCARLQPSIPEAEAGWPQAALNYTERPLANAALRLSQKDDEQTLQDSDALVHSWPPCP